MDYLNINRENWNARTELNFSSDFYDMPAFLAGKNTLKEIELPLLGDVAGKSILHLQCHFGQDTLSLARMGAQVTGIDLSDAAIEKAREVASQMGIDARFILCDVYSLPEQLDEKFDIVFTSYGTIGWLPDLDRWAGVVQHFLKPGGKFVFAEFHPVVWMFDDDFNRIDYAYNNSGVLTGTETGSYADRSSDQKLEWVCWNHGLGEVLNALIGQGIEIREFHEFDYSPFPCFNGEIEAEPGKWRIEKLGNKIPMVYSLRGTKSAT